MTTHKEDNEYDIIFAGGGTAACIAAGRLAKANPELSILLIEGGKNNLNDPTVTEPAIYLAHLAPTSQTALFYQAEAEENLNGREAIVPCGGILGGGSSINFMMYTRGQASDYDSWKTEGWDFKSLLPYFKKFETYHGEGDKETHGFDGPINVSYGTYGPKGPQDDFLAAAGSLGEKEIKDMQDFKTCGGFSRWARYIGPDGKRQDTAHRYIHPLMQSGQYPNLHLLLEHKVVRVLFDESKKANGVEYEPSTAFQETIALSKTPSKSIKAKKLVVVSAGTLSTPSILERSGVGNPEVLDKLKIDVVSDLKGVGEEYQDHHLLLYPYKTSLTADDTIDGLLSGRLDFAGAIGDKNPLLGWNAIDVCSKLRPSEADVENFSSELKEAWDRDFKEQTDRPLMLMGVVSSFLGDHKILNEEKDGVSQYCTMGTYTAYPYSRGSIHIKSKSVQTPASFKTGFLSSPLDLEKQVWAYKKQREFYRRTNAYLGELAIGHPSFKEGSKAALCDGPAVKGGFKSVQERQDLPLIEYDEADDEAIRDWVRSNLNTTWHSLGTCAMRKREDGGVVDKDLNVYGTTGLKLCDLSIVPENVGANTNNTALMIGEKAADIIGKELGLTV